MTARERVRRLERVIDELGTRLARLPDGEGGEMAAFMYRTMGKLRAAERAAEASRF
jgi:hypothetical protein